MRLFDRRVARSAPSERARDAARGGDSEEYVQLCDGALKAHTRRTQPAPSVARRASPVAPESDLLRHRRDASLRARSVLARETNHHAESARKIQLFTVREPRFFSGASRESRLDRASFAKSEYRSRFAVKRVAEKRDFVDSARRCRSTRGRFFFIGGIREITSQLARRFPSHPRKPARDSSHETRVSASDVAWDVRRHSRTARVQALRSASRRASPELSSLRARAQRARVVRTETDARARVPAGYAASRISAFFSASHGTVRRSDTDSIRWPPAPSPPP